MPQWLSLSLPFHSHGLLYAVPLRININVQIIDEDQCQGNKEWGKQRASITIGTMNKDTCAFVSEFGQVCC